MGPVSYEEVREQESDTVHRCHGDQLRAWIFAEPNSGGTDSLTELTEMVKMALSLKELLTLPCSICAFKAGTHRPNCWTSEALGEAHTKSGTNLFGVLEAWKLLERCRLRMSIRSLRRRAVRRLSHWILWLVVCQLNGRSDWRCASESVQCVGGAEYCVRFVFLCTLFHHSLFSCFAVLIPVVLYVQDEWICVCLVMTRYMFTMQLFLSEIVKFNFDRK